MSFRTVAELAVMVDSADTNFDETGVPFSRYCSIMRFKISSVLFFLLFFNMTNDSQLLQIKTKKRYKANTYRYYINDLLGRSGKKQWQNTLKLLG